VPRLKSPFFIVFSQQIHCNTRDGLSFFQSNSVEICVWMVEWSKKEAK
jgi:hypothetical protein